MKIIIAIFFFDIYLLMNKRGIVLQSFCLFFLSAFLISITSVLDKNTIVILYWITTTYTLASNIPWYMNDDEKSKIIYDIYSYKCTKGIILYAIAKNLSCLLILLLMSLLNCLLLVIFTNKIILIKQIITISGILSLPFSCISIFCASLLSVNNKAPYIGLTYLIALPLFLPFILLGISGSFIPLETKTIMWLLFTFFSLSLTLILLSSWVIINNMKCE